MNTEFDSYLWKYISRHMKIESQRFACDTMILCSHLSTASHLNFGHIRSHQFHSPTNFCIAPKITRLFFYFIDIIKDTQHTLSSIQTYDLISVPHIYELFYQVGKKRCFRRNACAMAVPINSYKRKSWATGPPTSCSASYMGRKSSRP